ncbi:MAG: ABC transporter permease [Acidobacteria bacterium]|jgi:putative ABC transport system permease protein|nr:ABC transporter permease [Acidobacteriota bacterium]
MRWGLFNEIFVMSVDTLRTNKMRSGLTVLGIVIGITSIVGMTSLIRGLDQSLRDSIASLGADTITVAKFSGLSMAAGNDFQALLMRPNMTPDDAEAIRREAPSIAIVDVMLGDGGPPTQERVYYRNLRTKMISVLGTTERWPDVVRVPLAEGRFFTNGEVERRRNVVVLGQTAVQALFPNQDAVGKTVRVGIVEYEVVGVADKRPSPGGFDLGVDDFVVIPQTTYQKQFGIRAQQMGRGEMRSILISAVPREGVSREVAMREVEQVMRNRHGLRLDEPNDFDLVTADAILELWDQISAATFLALVVISSIALMVGGIGVMSIMTITVTERTREIGVRKALGARRTEVLWQFLMEAIFLTSTGGVLGIICGAGIGMAVHLATGFPVSLPWWSFAIGIGFSAGIGVFFGMVPAIRASRMDPIDALRYE